MASKLSLDHLKPIKAAITGSANAFRNRPATDPLNSLAYVVLLAAELFVDELITEMQEDKPRE